MVNFNYHSRRAKSARLALRFRIIQPILIVLAILCIIVGAALVARGVNIGYLVASLAAPERGH